VIVRHAGGVLHLITQPDHARLAGAIMAQAAALAAHPRRASILLAISEHDNGWTEPDAAPLVDPATGVPLDFISAPAAVRQGVWPRGVRRLGNDPWAAALVAQHSLAIFERYRRDPAWSGFFAGMETLRGSYLHAGGGRLGDLLDDYRFVRLGDVISLTFCNAWTEIQQSGEWRLHLSGDRLTVLPDPFDGREIPIAIQAREIPRRAFGSDEELRSALAAAPLRSLTGVITSPPS